LEIAEGPFAAQSAWHSVARQAEALDALAAGHVGAILPVALGETRASQLLPPLCRALRQRNLFVGVLACDPLAAGAEPDVRAVEQEADLLVRLPPNMLSAGLTAQSPVSALHAAAEKKLLAAVETLVCVLARAEGGFTLRALQQALRGGGSLGFGLGMAQGADAPLRAADAALAQLRESLPGRLEMEREPEGVAAAVLTGRELSVAEAGALGEICRGGAARNRSAVLLGHATHDCLDGEAICLLLARYAVGRKIVRLAGPSF
jgi:hypothetical protein